MPTVLRIGGFRFHFYSDEKNEPPHIHVATADGACKFWLMPVKLAKSKNVKPHITREIELLVHQNQELLKKACYDYHGYFS